MVVLNQVSGGVQIGTGLLIGGDALAWLCAHRPKPTAKRRRYRRGHWQRLAIGLLSVALGCMFITGLIASLYTRVPILAADGAMILWLAGGNIHDRRVSRNRRHGGAVAAPTE
jgi:hypothetical protein